MTHSAKVELVRSIYAAWERGDFSSADWAASDVELVIAEGVNAATWTGIVALADAWREYLGAYEDWRVEAEEVRPLDSERVLVLARRHGRGKRSGLELEEIGQTANVFHIRDGRVTRLVLYDNRQRALADAGLQA